MDERPAPVRTSATPRHLSCRSVLWIAAAPRADAASVAGPPSADAPPRVLSETEYRRCPVGILAAVDCPEVSGVRCLLHSERGDDAPQVVCEADLPLLAAELAAEGYPSERYARRNRSLWSPEARPTRTGPWAGTAPTAAPTESTAPARRAPSEPAAAPPRVPVNVPVDSVRSAKQRFDRGRSEPTDASAGS